MSVSIKLKKYLDENSIEYVTIIHSKAFTAQQIASSAHISGIELAKTVIVKIDEKYALAVLPAPEKISFQLFAEKVGARKVKLATENEFKDLFPDCQIGAMPPFGNLYNISTYMSPDFSDNKMITFNAGSHEELIRMKFSVFKNLVKPEIVHFEV